MTKSIKAFINVMRLFFLPVSAWRRFHLPHDPPLERGFSKGG
ncbi:hypothetical protein A45J_0218 [hot springs metagenome]|uniref:Uncharacterized protein n=1 Tax=hot springs metagenome TaxID=433727 RepID=A0A5J4KZM7_9ZZZZ